MDLFEKYGLNANAIIGGEDVTDKDGNKFVVDDDGKLLWALAKIKDEMSKKEKAEEEFEHQRLLVLAQLEEVRQSRVGGFESTIAWLKNIIEDYAKAKIEASGKTSMVFATVNGEVKVSSKKQQPEFLFNDSKMNGKDVALVEAVKEVMPSMVNVTEVPATQVESVDIKELKKHIIVDDHGDTYVFGVKRDDFKKINRENKFTVE